MAERPQQGEQQEPAPRPLLELGNGQWPQATLQDARRMWEAFLKAPTAPQESGDAAPAGAVHPGIAPQGPPPAWRA